MIQLKGVLSTFKGDRMQLIASAYPAFPWEPLEFQLVPRVRSHSLLYPLSLVQNTWRDSRATTASLDTLGKRHGVRVYADWAANTGQSPPQSAYPKSLLAAHGSIRAAISAGYSAHPLRPWQFPLGTEVFPHSCDPVRLTLSPAHGQGRGSASSLPRRPCSSLGGQKSS